MSKFFARWILLHDSTIVKIKRIWKKVDNFYIVYRIMGQYFMFYLGLILVKYG